ncbi:alpha/beta hydrolase [Isoptericola dokdonensis]|uniref:Carboxylesterase NlhH n=1 Tax=Isoptericola dokdonensis DS-3 TaxID=1300344 RepID=A0A168ESK7_9MICO|nr:alpha/beta hydrolase [Isoptericola dokdonensis]ANC30419.1 Carboxylesterase NlhH [Isoptericola dokdonensis DS-3]
MSAHPPHHAAPPTGRTPTVRAGGSGAATTGSRDDDHHDRRPRDGRRRSVTVVVLAVVAVLLALVAVGALLPGVPGLGHLGAQASAWAVWLAVAGLVVTLLGAVALLRHGSVARVVVVCAGLVAAVCSVVVVTVQLRVAQEHEVAVDIAEMFRVSQDRRAHDVDVTYGEQDGVPLGLSLWLPDGGTGTSAAAAPVVVLVHGGGWTGGHRAQAGTAAHATWFADQGYLVASVDYPLATATTPRWDTAEAQVACALVWLGQHAADHGGDPGRVLLAGDSAGGNLALDVAYRGAAGTLAPACEGPVPPVTAVSALYPVASPVAFHDNPDPLLGADARRYAETYTGGTPDEVPDRYASIWPAVHVTDVSPPTLMVHGAADHLVPAAGTQQLGDVLRTHGVTHDVVLVPAADHVFDRAPGGVGTQVWRELTARLVPAS